MNRSIDAKDSAIVVPIMGSGARSRKNSSRRVIAAVIIGNCFEWFDYIAYSFFAVVFAKQFFVTGSSLTSMLLALGTIGVGFFVRPFGGIWLCAYADRVGRKAALTVTIGLMTAGTALIACAPTYAQIGVAAPALIVLARLLQGFSTGGEMGSAAAFLIDRTAPERRNYYTSWVQASVGLSVLLSAGLGFYLTTWIEAADLNSWGWRVPFFLGLLLGPIGFYIRCQVFDPILAKADAVVKTPVREVIQRHSVATATGMGLTAL